MKNEKETMEMLILSTRMQQLSAIDNTYQGILDCLVLG